MKVGEDYVYWTDYSHKKLWSLRKDGSSEKPIILRTFRYPATGVVVFRHQPLDCSLVKIHHQAYRADGETLTIIFSTITLLMVLAMAAVLVIRLKDNRRPLVLSKKNEGTFAFQNLENGSSNNDVYTACERAIWYGRIIQYSSYSKYIFSFFYHHLILYKTLLYYFL